MLQLQTGLLVTDREWIDFISYSGGLPMVVIRVWPDAKVQDAILNAAAAFYANLGAKMAAYHETLAATDRAFPTERKITMEMF